MKKLDVRVRITEVDDVSDRLLIIYKAETSLKTDQFLKTVFAEIEELSVKITEAIKKDVVLSKLEDADLRRDNAVRMLHNVLLGYQSMPVPALKQHGEKLYKVFSKYGVSIIRESYATESSLIEALLQDLSAADLSESIAALSGVTESIANLRAEQTAFTQLRVGYEKAIVEQHNTPSASKLKKPLVELINVKLIGYLTAMKMVDAPKYEAFATAIGQVIENMNVNIRKRGKENTPNEGKTEEKEEK